MGEGRGAGPMGLWADSWDNSELMLQSRATCFCPDSDTGVKSTGFTGFTVVGWDPSTRKLKSGNHCCCVTTQVALVVRNPPANAGNVKDASSIPGLRRSPGERHGHPLQCSCLENPMDRGAWQAITHLQGVAKSWTQLKQFSTPACTATTVAS